MAEIDLSWLFDDNESLVRAAERWYHIPIIAISMAYMLFIRLRPLSRFNINGEIYYSGTDAYYHLRNVKYTVDNWPAVMPFDPFTNYPFGTHVGQFGTLYDQIIATIALIVGLGNPSDHTVRLVLLVAPAVFGTLATVPTYLIAKRLSSKFGGSMAVMLLALIPGEFLRRTVVGFADHNSAEPMFQAFAVAAVVYALYVAEEDVPVAELVLEREWESIKRPFKWSAIAGVAMGLYLWVWPPAFLLLGIYALAIGAWMIVRGWRGKTPEPAAFVTVIAMGVVAVFTLIGFESATFNPVKLSYLHLFGSLGLAAGAVVISAASRIWEQKNFSRHSFPAAFGLVGIVGVALSAILLPSLLDVIITNVNRFLFQFITAPERTITEAQPMTAMAQPAYGITVTDLLIRQYGLLFHLSIVLLGYTLIFDGDNRGSAARWVVGFWYVIIAMAALSQVRFNYYLAIPVAVICGYGFDTVRNQIDLTGLSALTDLNWRQSIAIVMVVISVIPVLIAPITIGAAGGQAIQTSNSMAVSGGEAPGDARYWDGTLNWMQENTPKEGTLGTGGEPMDPYGTYERPADGNYDYPDGAYGVMAWWDYGHWITVNAERIPYANPFQQGTNVAANFLLAPSEGRAESVINSTGDEHNLRYVMVDWQMINPQSKFSAPFAFYTDGSTSMREQVSPLYIQTQSGLQSAIYEKRQRYYENMMVRLYHFHGSAVPAQPVVLDWETTTAPNGRQVRSIEPGQAIKTFDNMTAAREYIQEDGTARIGGIGPHPRQDIEALNHYRLVKYSNASATESRSFARSALVRAQASGMGIDNLFRSSPAWVKVFERVPGATVQGEAPPNTTVSATVEMRIPATNETFTYRQYASTGADGEFTMTLPYSTTGYSNWGPENGYTNVSVRATGPYTFTTTGSNATATAEVTEAQVIGEDDSPVTVSIEGNQTEQESEQDSSSE